MSKKVFLYVRGGDYSAMEFEDTYDVQSVYEEMVEAGETSRIVEGEDDFYAEIEIVEFGEVDDKFVEFIIDNLCDYDQLKAADIFEVKPVN